MKKVFATLFIGLALVSMTACENLKQVGGNQKV